MTQHRYAVLGAGALGGFYGAKLKAAGHEVHFLLRSDWEHVRHHGLFVETPEGAIHLPQVAAYGDVLEMPPCDRVLVTLKTTSNHYLPSLLPHVLKEDGVVVTLQNGLGIEAEIADIVGRDRVMGGLCFICSNKVGPGHVRHLDYGSITLGEYAADGQPQPISERQQQIGQDFQQAGIETHLVNDLMLARWRKLVWNIPFNGLSVVLDASTEELMADPHSRELAAALMRETVESATVCLTANPDTSGKASRIISPEFVEEMLAATEQMKPYRTSMKIDFDEHRNMEVEAIFGNALRAAQQAGHHPKRIEALYQQLKFLDTRNQRIRVELAL